MVKSRTKTNICLHKVYTNLQNCDIVQEEFVHCHSFSFGKTEGQHAVGIEQTETGEQTDGAFYPTFRIPADR